MHVFWSFFEKNGLTMEKAIFASRVPKEPWIIAFNLSTESELESGILSAFTDDFGGRIGVPERIDFGMDNIRITALLSGPGNLKEERVIEFPNTYSQEYEGVVEIDFSGDRVIAVAKRVNMLTGDTGLLESPVSRVYSPSLLSDFASVIPDLMGKSNVVWTGKV